ncbi:MAG: VOC family protein [Candidatus Eiseniibacteriota bacterium]
MTESAPTGRQTLTVRIVVEDPASLIGFLKRVFAATGEVYTDIPSQIVIGNSVLMVSKAGPRDVFPAFLYAYVEDADATCARAIEAGALLLEPAWDTPYGDRRGMVRDPWGNVWQIASSLSRQGSGRA